MLRRVPASRLHRALEFVRMHVGLPVSRLALDRFGEVINGPANTGLAAVSK